MLYIYVSHTAVLLCTVHVQSCTAVDTSTTSNSLQYYTQQHSCQISTVAERRAHHYTKRIQIVTCKRRAVDSTAVVSRAGPKIAPHTEVRLLVATMPQLLLPRGCVIALHQISTGIRRIRMHCCCAHAASNALFTTQILSSS